MVWGTRCAIRQHYPILIKETSNRTGGTLCQALRQACTDSPSAQFIEPAIANSMKPIQQVGQIHKTAHLLIACAEQPTNLSIQMDWPRIMERVLKLALPNLYAWLCMFYCLFHLWLNILAELLRWVGS